MRDEPIRIGISACLLGQRVRYDGGHKRDAFITETLGRYFQWVPVCPEVELGLGTPRQPIRLETRGGPVRLVVPATSIDLTADMRRYADRRLADLAAADLCGYILKSNSPSCGLEHVPVHQTRGRPVRIGRGLFAQRLLAAFPHLPVEEESRLCDPRLRENWIERVFAYLRLKALWRPRWTLGDVRVFHFRHRLQLWAHSPESAARLDRLVLRAGRLGRRELRRRYSAEFMQALGQIADVRRHARVLRHIAGHFEQELDGQDRAELRQTIRDYRRRLVPLLVPLTLLKHFVRRCEVQALCGQSYLEMQPKELALRYHV